MTFAQYFKGSSYCLITAGFIAIVAAGGIDPVFLAIFGFALLVSWFIDTAKFRRRIPTWFLNCLAFAYLPFLIIDYMLLSRSFVLTIVHLVLFASAIKLLTISRDRDYLFLYLVSLVELLAASTLTVNIIFAICFFFFLLSGISTLILFEMRRSNAKMQDKIKVQPLVIPERLRGTGFELFSPFPARLVSVMTVGMTLLILAVAVPLFYLLPRATLGLYNRPSGDAQFISGFSERVELGQIGTIKQSDAVVMRVRLSKPPSNQIANLKWRGIAFDHYDGRSWRRSNLNRRKVPEQGWFYKLEEFAQGTDWLNQTFFIEALSTDVVFAAHKVLAVSKDVGFLERDFADNLYTIRPSAKKLRYFSISDSIEPNPKNISDRALIPQEIRDIYCQLPSEDSRIADLAKEVTRPAGDKYAKAQALEQYLRSHYTYSLQLSGAPNSKDPLAMFLFDVRKGHCEYFASAMTIMLRQLEIPARLVNGFRGGEYNNIGNNWVIRQYNAHSWVEAYFPPYGWVEFDPTPAEPHHPRSEFARFFSNLTDAIDLWWWEDIVNYDFSKQYQVINNLRSSVDDFQRRIGRVLTQLYEEGRKGAALIRSPKLRLAFERKWIVWIFLVAGTIFLLAGDWRRRFFRLIRRALNRGDQAMIMRSFYMEALELLEAHGMKRGLGQTPLEFAQSLGDHPAAVPFLDLTRMYNEIRFGPLSVSPRASKAGALLHSLRAAIKART